MGLKSAKFPSAFDGPSLWSTIETLGHYTLSINKGIPSLVSEAILTKQSDLVKTILTDLRNDFVVEADWNTFFQNLGGHMKTEAEDKVVYHKVMTACTRHLDDLEKLARSGSGTTAKSATLSIYDPFQQSSPNPLGSHSNEATVDEFNDRLDSLEGIP